MLTWSRSSRSLTEDRTPHRTKSSYFNPAISKSSVRRISLKSWFTPWSLTKPPEFLPRFCSQCGPSTISNSCTTRQQSTISSHCSFDICLSLGGSRSMHILAYRRIANHRFDRKIGGRSHLGRTRSCRKSASSIACCLLQAGLRHRHPGCTCQSPPPACLKSMWFWKLRKSRLCRLCRGGKCHRWLRSVVSNRTSCTIRSRWRHKLRSLRANRPRWWRRWWKPSLHTMSQTPPTSCTSVSHSSHICHIAWRIAKTCSFVEIQDKYIFFIINSLS